MMKSRTTITLAVISALVMVALVLTSAAAMNPSLSTTAAQTCAQAMTVLDVVPADCAQ